MPAPKIGKAEVSSGLKELFKFGASLGLKAVDLSPVAVDLVAQTMVDDELGEGAWSKLKADEKRVWRYRARAAVRGLNAHVYS